MQNIWRSPLANRLYILLGSVLGWAYFIFGQFNIGLVIILGAIIYYQLRIIIQRYHQLYDDVNAFLDAIWYDDPEQSFKTKTNDAVLQGFHTRLNEAMKKFRSMREIKDSEYLFFKNVVQHIGIGILAIRKDSTITLANTAARNLLRMKTVTHIDELSTVSEELVHSILQQKTGGRDLVRVKIGDDEIPLSIYVIELTLKNEVVKVVTMSNLQSELEQKEMEAWQNLVRVLTHEIMNSVTPISSLSSVMEDELKIKLQPNSANFNEDELQDLYLSLQTISRRSEGLIKFVKEFRSFAKTPKPQPSDINVKTMINNIVRLHKGDLTEQQIKVSVEIDPENLTLWADKVLIEQVLINILKNAMQAFDGISDKHIDFKGGLDEHGKVFISIADNGSGIEAEALEKIFIPFYSTKSTGSGIGLSLSKRIMNLHDGRLIVKSALGEGTVFHLRFEGN